MLGWRGEALSLNRIGVNNTRRYANGRLEPPPVRKGLLSKHPSQTVGVQRTIQPQLQLVDAGGFGVGRA